MDVQGSGIPAMAAEEFGVGEIREMRGDAQAGKARQRGKNEKGEMCSRTLAQGKYSTSKIRWWVSSDQRDRRGFVYLICFGVNFSPGSLRCSSGRVRSEANAKKTSARFGRERQLRLCLSTGDPEMYCVPTL